MSQVTENKVISAPVPMTPLQEFWHYLNATKARSSGWFTSSSCCSSRSLPTGLHPITRRQQFRDALLAPPAWQEGGSMAHLLGTDDVGRDVLSRLMYGARLSLLVGCLVVVLSLIMGVIRPDRRLLWRPCR